MLQNPESSCLGFTSIKIVQNINLKWTVSVTGLSLSLISNKIVIASMNHRSETRQEACILTI